jgi:2-C-methyl-D-erythritol 2,4-cyclodiphosphate synthase
VSDRGPAPPDAIAAAPPVIRVGQGFDVHPFSDDPDRPLVLGGVRFPEVPGLAGHSDADVITHAVTDALLGAAGLGDIGQHFPDTDPALAGADSVELLLRAVADVRAAGWLPQNVDCTVVLERPRLAPRRHVIEARLGAAVGAPVTVKGKRAEGLGALGRAEGIACFAVALVARPNPGAGDGG